MQIRCSTCTKTIAIAPTGALPVACPHCDKPAVPERVGDYVLDRLVATGGMGEVYLAQHHELGSEVAIKLLPAMSLEAADGLRKRFAREAKLTARVDHPGIVRVLTSDIAHDRPYLVLEFITGQTLRHRLANGPVPVLEAARIAHRVADVLSATHAQGVLHRDIKPDNVMVQPDGAVRVLDFGIARALADDAPLTRTGEIVGTPEYMAPEQLLDGPEATDERTDVHAIGLLLFELLTGRSPFRGANVFQALKLVESLVPPPPSQHATTAPKELDEVVQRALQKRPEDRFATASELARALERAVPDVRAPVQPATAPQSRRWLLWPAALLMAAATALTLWLREPTAPRASATTVAEITSEQRRAQLAQMVHEGRWCSALTGSEDAFDEGLDEARSTARRAFLLSRAAWFYAAGLPHWLSANDQARHQRLFGDLLEPLDQASLEARATLIGDENAWRMLTDDAPEGSALAALLRIRELPTEQRADAFGNYAQRLPIDEPEHWLARTIERHLRDDAAGGAQAAEMAWLSGAGEVAVLLDGAFAVRNTELSHKQKTKLWMRIAMADRADCPASALLLLLLQTNGGVRMQDGTPIAIEPEQADCLPVPHKPGAIAWLLDSAATADEMRALGLLRLAVGLGARPDFDSEPWKSCSHYARMLLEREANK